MQACQDYRVVRLYLNYCVILHGDVNEIRGAAIFVKWSLRITMSKYRTALNKIAILFIFISKYC